ncbi:MAG: helix-turn-helix domain-containing protein [Methyloprofundus sp.]|nr:helix-turn-helix domain-containing protein [Methyloprofundus sp.]
MMIESPTLPLIRASFLEAFYRQAKVIGSPVESILQSLHLPAQLPNDLNLLLPEIPCWKFVQAISQREGHRYYGLETTNNNPWTQLISMQPLFKDCCNLYSLLKRLIYFSPVQSNTSRFKLKQEGGFIWFISASPCLLPDADHSQVIGSTLLGMIQLIQTAAGTHWRPEEIHLPTPHSRDLANSALLNPSRILFSQTELKILLPRMLLALPLTYFTDKHQTEAQNIEDYPNIANSLTEQLAASVIPYLGSGALNKKLMADMLGTSPRTLQRRLEKQSSSYSSIIDQARFTHAQSLLKTSDHSLIDISLMLGYQNASSFSRSFRRWTGVSPSEFQGLL